MIIDGHVAFGFNEPGYYGMGIGAEELIERMNAAMIDKAVIFPTEEWYFDPWSTSQMDVNRKVAEAVRKYPDRLIGFGRVNPWYKHSLQDAENFIRKLKLSGLGEFHPDVDFFPANHKIMYPFMELAAKLKVPVKCHTGVSANAAPALWADLLERFPDVTAIMCHMGGAAWWQAVTVAKKFSDNVYLEWSFAPSLFPFGKFGVLKKAVEEVGADRVIWGSDEPYGNFFMALREVKEAGLTENQKKLVMSGNLIRILHL